MTADTAAPAPRPMLTSRTNASHKLLARKAAEKLPPQPNGERIEDSFPSAPDEVAAGQHAAAAGAATVRAPSGLSTPSAVPASTFTPAVAATTPQPAAAWSDEDERTFKVQSARRKAAGYHTRGNDVCAQLLTVGSIKPNPDTTVAVIVGLVAERGTIPRASLVSAMASVKFPHPKAQPADAVWCQGYVAGSIRNGFLKVINGISVSDGDA